MRFSQLSFYEIQLKSLYNLINGIHCLETKGSDLHLFINSLPESYSKRFNSFHLERLSRLLHKHIAGSSSSMPMMNKLCMGMSSSACAFLIHPAASLIDNGEKAIQIISDRHQNLEFLEFNLPNNIIKSLVLHLYYNKDWIYSDRRLADHVISFKSSEIFPIRSEAFSIKLFYFTGASQEYAVKTKSLVRDAYGISTASIHSTDNVLETQVLSWFLIHSLLYPELQSTLYERVISSSHLSEFVFNCFSVGPVVRQNILKLNIYDYIEADYRSSLFPLNMHTTPLSPIIGYNHHFLLGKSFTN